MGAGLGKDTRTAAASAQRQQDAAAAKVLRTAAAKTEAVMAPERALPSRDMPYRDEIDAWRRKNPRVVVQETNPKSRDSKSWERYEVYKRARTVNDFFELGGKYCDFRHDYTRGFISVLK